MENTPLREIKKSLSTIYSTVEQLIPLDKTHIHPFTWIEDKMKRIVEETNTIKKEVEAEVSRIEEEVRGMEEELQALSECLEGAPTPKEWLNLVDKRDKLGEILLRRTEEYSEREERLRERVRRVVEIGDVLENGSTEEKVLSLIRDEKKKYWIKKEYLERMDREVEKGEEVLRVLEEKRRREVEEINSIVRRLGLSGMEGLGLVEESLEEWRMEEVGEGSGGALGIKATTALLHRAAGIEEMFVQRKEGLMDRIEKITKRLEKEKAVREVNTVLDLIGLEREAKEMEEEYRRRYKEIITKKEEELAGVIGEMEKLREGTEREGRERGGEERRVEREKEKERERERKNVEEEEEALLELDNLINISNGKLLLLKAISDHLSERVGLLEKMVVFERQASDPKRLFRSSFQLNSEEKFRKMAVPTLLKIEREVMESERLYAEKYKEDVVIGGKEAVKDLKEEIKKRIINTNVFINTQSRTEREAS